MICALPPAHWVGILPSDLRLTSSARHSLRKWHEHILQFTNWEFACQACVELHGRPPRPILRRGRTFEALEVPRPILISARARA